MSDQSVVFDNTVATLLRMASQLDAAGQAQLRAAGLPLDQKLAPAYPAADWSRWVLLLGQLRHPGLAPMEAHRRIGAETARLFMDNAIGRALFALLRILGPKRALLRLTRNMRTANNYTETRATERGPGDFEVWINDVNGVPGFYEGLLLTALTTVGAPELRVSFASSEGPAATYSVRWKTQAEAHTPS